MKISPIIMIGLAALMLRGSSEKTTSTDVHTISTYQPGDVPNYAVELGNVHYSTTPLQVGQPTKDIVYVISERSSALNDEQNAVLVADGYHYVGSSDSVGWINQWLDTGEKRYDAVHEKVGKGFLIVYEK